MTNEKKAQLSDERIVGIALDMGLRGMPRTFVDFARAVLAASSPSPEEAEAARQMEPSEWMEVERIRELPEVDEALLNFKDDCTGDNAAMVVRAVMRATRGVALPDGGKSNG